MIDAICMTVSLAFLGILIYSIVTSPPKKPTESPIESCPPSPVGLFCSICHAFAGTVSSEEYSKICQAGEPVYCESCMSTIEIYKRRQGPGA